MSRYSRQELFAGIGPAGQHRLRAARVLVVGCGALGSVLSEMLVRSGVAALRVVDRDYVEESNLHRQSLFEEADLWLPKAAAAEIHLRRINSEVAVEGVVADLTRDNAEALLEGADLVLDGTDNFETRFLLNDLCLAARIPWVYGACVGSYGLALVVRPLVTPCLRCVLADAPAPGQSPTCDTAGVIAPIVHVVAGIQVAEALKLLCGRPEVLLPGLVTVDLWQGFFEVMDLTARAPWCRACTAGEYASLAAPRTAASLCGRNAVQVRPLQPGQLDLDALALRLAQLGAVTSNLHLVRFCGEETELVVFADGRAIVKVDDVARARSLYAKYVGC